MIEEGRALLDVAELDQRRPELAHGAERKVRVGVLPGERQRFAGTALGHVRLRLVDEFLRSHKVVQ